MTQSRRKGNVGELQVRDVVRPWWRLHEPEVDFARTPGSGGFGTPVIRSGFRISGDLMTTSRIFPWCIEVKRRERFVWKNVLSGAKSPVWGWWGQTVRSAEEMGVRPMMWFRHVREPWMVMVGMEEPFVVAKLGRFISRGVFLMPAKKLLAMHPNEILGCGVTYLGHDVR